jgi:hypothetical protein
MFCNQLFWRRCQRLSQAFDLAMRTRVIRLNSFRRVKRNLQVAQSFNSMRASGADGSFEALLEVRAIKYSQLDH